jgi:poly(hydroxyalkanoate) depolymerase family esterase
VEVIAMLRLTLTAGAVAALAFPWTADLASAATILERTLPAASQPGSRERRYRIAVPDGLAAGTPVPLVMVLHGCQQTEGDMIHDTRFVELAEREGFVAVFPFITSWPMVEEQRAPNCWGFWFEQHQHEGRGEPGDLRRILAEVERELPIDPERRYAAGLSSGAAMAVVLAVTYSEDFAAAGAVAGLPYDESACAVAGACFLEGLRHKSVGDLVAAIAAEQSRAEEQRLVPMLAIHSRNDGKVPFKNAQNIRDVWMARYAASSAAEERDCTTEGVVCRHSVFRDGAGRSVVETVFYDGPPFVRSHAWIGDNAGQFADPNGPSATELLWAFFAANPREAGPAVRIAFDPVAIDGRSATVSGTVSGDVDVAQVLVRLDGPAPQPERAAAGTQAWSVRFDELPDDQRYRPIARVELPDGTARSAVGPIFAIGDPTISVSATFNEHILGGRIAVQRPPCQPGFGVCDADFNSLFFQFGLSPFALHATDAAGPWYLDPANIASR